MRTRNLKKAELEKVFRIVDDKLQRFTRGKWKDLKVVPNNHGYCNIKFKTIMVRYHQVMWILTHEEIPEGKEIDHINGDPLDNRISNLRLSTHSQNIANSRRKTFKGKTSNFRGLSWSFKSNIWRVRIKVRGKTYYIGSFRNERAAAKAYDAFALEFFGEFASLNMCG